MDPTAWPQQRANEGSQSLSPKRDRELRKGSLSRFAILTAFFFLPSIPLAAQNKPAGYVGSDTCQGCHDDLAKAFQKNPHHFVETKGKNGWQGMACESCHGPGAKHAETTSPSDIINPSKVAPAKTDQICLKCHLNQPTHIGRIHSSHAKDQVACTSCHAIHKGPQALRPTRLAAINQQCATCHTSVWAQFQKPYKHRLPEGAMSCTDCHNPHGSLLPWQIRTVAADEPGCFRCHGDKRGPFTFEHPPVKTDGCIACHEAHGSANPRMLTRHEVRFVCLECHSNIGVQNTLGGPPPAFHDLRSARYQNCTICHVKIHGSYVDAALEH
jgi:DmsE family decaheme c-type cytochrome